MKIELPVETRLMYVVIFDNIWHAHKDTPHRVDSGGTEIV